ncbi:DUF397 domain-containing protein [Nocardia sp. SYP-A9097]|uniref:DUF397 domain-containing protein n=1 Tax=Nocardia sp. SYP-A9097 TaxID=2663237 RepID=UPI00129AE2B7|nr:DUF397 domain-containing protein [Nocardia sp. SYP-A9097]MRH86647.1 DUF397 domain-containing protein [Nocardia sp. SYP-A9097]
MSAPDLPRIRGWFKSSWSSETQTCVEVRLGDEVVTVRDSKFIGSAEYQPVVSVAAGQWPALLELAGRRVSGEVADSVAIAVGDDGGAVISGQGVSLVYDRGEWDAFVKGVVAGEFAFG